MIRRLKEIDDKDIYIRFTTKKSWESLGEIILLMKIKFVCMIKIEFISPLESNKKVNRGLMRV
jgi:hypothetical protein